MRNTQDSRNLLMNDGRQYGRSLQKSSRPSRGAENIRCGIYLAMSVRTSVAVFTKRDVLHDFLCWLISYEIFKTSYAHSKHYSIKITFSPIYLLIYARNLME